MSKLPQISNYGLSAEFLAEEQEWLKHCLEGKSRLNAETGHQVKTAVAETDLSNLGYDRSINGNIISAINPSLIQELRCLKSHFMGAACTIDRVLDLFEQSGGEGISVADIPTRKERKSQAVQTIDDAPESEDICDGVPEVKDLCDSPGPSTSTTEISGRHRRKIIVGRGSCNSRISSASTPGEIFISNVSREVTVSDLTDFLESTVTILGLYQISHPNACSKSFLLRVPSNDEHRVLDPKFWPPGLECRRFVRPAQGRLARG
jgi:hypothetical protein